MLEGEYDKLNQWREQRRQEHWAQKSGGELKSPQHGSAEVKAPGSGRAINQVGGSHRPTPDDTCQAPSLALQPVHVSQTNTLKVSYKGTGKDATPAPVQYHDRPKLSGLAQRLRKKSSVDIRHRAGLPVQMYQPKLGDGPPKTANNTSTPPTSFDAPVSAVNAGERRVEVRYEKSTITLPVTPTTTVRDVLNSASLVMSQPIDPRTSILIEAFDHLGLERPLRRYERIRDVMNSWDSDTQNYLLVLPESECAAAGLEQEDAPTEPPWKTVVQMYHSQKPGRWDKRWMTLKSDGQVTGSSKNNDLDATNAFHLSDFDIYMLTKRQMKRLRPPKKICFAIKSQQRSIVFESTENFVHFFCTNEKETADRWYNSVQAWRSYYLVNVLGEGVGNKVIPTNALEAVAVSAEPRPSISRPRDSVPYQLGTFKTLLDISADEFRYSLHASSTLESSSTLHARKESLVTGAKNGQTDQYRQKSSPRRSASIQRSSEPPYTRKQSLVSATRTKSIEKSTSQPPTTETAFTGAGLLATVFDQIKHPDDSANLYEDTSQGFTGKGLLSRTMSRRTRPHAHNSTEPSTLLNLQDDPSAFTGAGLLAQQQHTNSRKSPETLLEPTSTDQAFTGTGLIRTLTTKKSQSRVQPGQTLVDLSAQPTFQTGSLLRQIEDVGFQHGHGVVIDRTKGVEVTQKVGEGY